MKWVITRNRQTGKQSVCTNILAHAHKEWEHYCVEAPNAEAAFHAASVLREKQRRLSDKPTALIMGLISDARKTGRLKWTPALAVKAAAERLHMLGLVKHDTEADLIQMQPMAWNLINDFRGLPNSLTRSVTQDVYVASGTLGVAPSNVNLTIIAQKVEKRFDKRTKESVHVAASQRRELAQAALASKANRISAMTWRVS